MPEPSQANTVDPDTSSASAPPLRLTPAQLFLSFAEMSFYGYGGVTPWVHRVLVERRGWIDDCEFAEMLSVCQLVPGDNVTNMAVTFGYRYGGAIGAVAALLGVLALPFFLVLALGSLYARYGSLGLVTGALRGTSIVVAGLIVATAIKIALAQPRTVRALILGLFTFGAVGVLRLPLTWALLALIPLAIAAEWRSRK